MIEEYKKRLGDCIEVSEKLDIAKLPYLIRGILTQLLEPLCVGIPRESLLIDINVKLAQVVAHHRVKIKLDENNLIPVNYYAILFMPSGGGKDKPPKMIDKYLLKDFEKKFYKDAEKYHAEKNRGIIEKAEEKFPSSKAQREKYIQDNSARMLIKDFPNATVEGFAALRQAFSEAGFGATFLKISEFGDFITSGNSTHADLLSMIADVYDTGDHAPKIIKGEKEVYPVKDVPSNALMHTSLFGLYEDEGRKKLMTFFNRGLARRSFICYPEISSEEIHIDDLDGYLEAEFEAEEEAAGNAKIFVRYLEAITSKLSKQYTAVQDVLTMTPDARKLHRIYKMYNESRAIKINAYDEQEGLRAEMKTRDWKTLKLAGLIAAVVHPGEWVISVDDIKAAIYQTEFFGQHMQRFYDNEQPTDADKLFGFFKESEGWLSLTDIKRKKLCAARKFSEWFGETIEEVRELAASKGYKLEFSAEDRNKKRYRVIKI